MNEIENIVKDYKATKEKYASKDFTDVDADDQAYYWRSSVQNYSTYQKS